ncbi:MAG TPA: hypothetical protein VI565_02365, partial [Burkholderiales bacterium]|nr:hypothetical protein [Burkholderiales bacterium]
TGLMPTLLVERLGLSVSHAGAVSAAIVLANAVGNLAASFALWAGIPLWAIVATAFAFMGAASFGIFADSMPVATVAVLASASLAITGLIPASLLAATTRLAPTTAQFGMMYGLMSQISNVGHVLGPALLGAWAQTFGWATAPVLFAIVALSGVATALWLRRLLLRQPN